jgi:hypothetical protein
MRNDKKKLSLNQGKRMMILVTIVRKILYHEFPIEYAFNEGKGDGFFLFLEYLKGLWVHYKIEV